MKGLIPFTVIVSILHFFEDALLIMLGRYTEINILILFMATIAFGFVVAAVAKHPKVHKVFHD
mgnify:FL=1